VDDKKVDLESAAASSTGPADIVELALAKDWTDAEERAVVRKLDFIVMPLVWLGFFVFQLQRGNIANAVTDGFEKNIGITQNQFNSKRLPPSPPLVVLSPRAPSLTLTRDPTPAGNGVLYLGIVLLEIPSNILLNKFGAQRWITAQIFCFGVIALSQAWISSYGSYIATRILLGIAECGYIPGALYVISTFYKGSELATRNGLFFTGSATASACTGLLAYGLLPLAGTNGLRGWQWLFIIEGGVIALTVGTLFLLFLPHSPERPTPLLFPRLHYFNERQRHILRARVVLDDARKHDQSRALHWHEIRRTLTNTRVWPHVFISLPVIAATGAMGTYGPSLIKQLGFTTLKANALSSVGSWIGVVLLLLTGFGSDKLKLRGPMVIATILILWVWWIAFQQTSLGTDKWLKFAFITLVTAFGQVFHPLNGTWLSLNMATPQERSIAMACFVMAANTGAAVGSQLLRSGDTDYHKGFRACVGLVSAGLLVAICQHVQYRWSNRRLRSRAAVGENVRLYVE